MGIGTAGPCCSPRAKPTAASTRSIKVSPYTLLCHLIIRIIDLPHAHLLRLVSNYTKSQPPVLHHTLRRHTHSDNLFISIWSSLPHTTHVHPPHPWFFLLTGFAGSSSSMVFYGQGTQHMAGPAVLQGEARFATAPWEFCSVSTLQTILYRQLCHNWRCKNNPHITYIHTHIHTTVKTS